jgi:ferrous iron transport protein B
MSSQYASILKKIKEETDYTVALAGNPNVGKSSIFNRLTGMGVVTANYPGKTVEINVAPTYFEEYKIGIIDLPGTYAIGAVSEDQWVARRGILEGKPDVAIVVVDATNLSRNLYMVLQLKDLGIPMVMALNLHDVAEKTGLRIDRRKLSKILGMPVVPTIATSGEGLRELVQTTVKAAEEKGKVSPAVKYGRDIEEKISELSKAIETSNIKAPYRLYPRALSILLLEKDKEFIELISGLPHGSEVLGVARRLMDEIRTEHGENSPMRVARERHGVSGTIADQVTSSIETGFKENRFWKYTTASLTGIPILISVLVLVFAVLFFVGGSLSSVLGNLWASYLSPVIMFPVKAVFGNSWMARVFKWGFDDGINATLQVGIPYVLIFYFLLAMLEDSGYLNSAAFLTDRLMHKAGLHGRAIIPLVAGAGCNVPAIIGTRVLNTRRERIIASTLIVLVPCSARTAVIMGAVSLYAGWRAAAVLFFIITMLIGAVGWGLNKIMPGTSTGLVMEMFPFRMPSLQNIFKKTWFRFREFIFVAAPIVIIGSMILGFLYETGLIWKLAKPMSPIVTGWLGLPAVAGLTLLFAVLRKELALQLLVALATIKYGKAASSLLHFMTKDQIFVYALVNSIYIPCIATISVLGRELGWRAALTIMGFTISLAVFIGGIANLSLAHL